MQKNPGGPDVAKEPRKALTRFFKSINITFKNSTQNNARTSPSPRYYLFPFVTVSFLEHFLDTLYLPIFLTFSKTLKMVYFYHCFTIFKNITEVSTPSFKFVKTLVNFYFTKSRVATWNNSNGLITEKQRCPGLLLPGWCSSRRQPLSTLSPASSGL